MKIWIDIDGVLSAFTPNVVQIANELWPGKIPLDYFPRDWDYSDVLSKEEWDEIWQNVAKIPDFWLRQQPIEPNVRALQSFLAEDRHQVFYITSRHDTGTPAYQQTAQWLIHHDLYLMPARLVVTKKPSEKKQVVQEHNIEMGIDDLPSTVADMNLMSWHHCFLLDAPYNQTTNQARVHSLQEFLDLVRTSASLQGI